MKIFIDDERRAPRGWVPVKTNGTAIKMIRSCSLSIDTISFDFDAGEDGTFMDVVNSVIRMMTEGELRGKKIEILIHSSNPVGALQISNRFLDFGIPTKRVSYNYSQ